MKSCIVILILSTLAIPGFSVAGESDSETSTPSFLEKHPALYMAGWQAFNTAQALENAGNQTAALPFKKAYSRMISAIPAGEDAKLELIKVRDQVKEYQVEAQNGLFNNSVSNCFAINNIVDNLLEAGHASNMLLIDLLVANDEAAQCFTENDSFDLAEFVLHKNLSIIRDLHPQNTTETIFADHITAEMNGRLSKVEMSGVMASTKRDAVFNYANKAVVKYESLLASNLITPSDAVWYEQALRSGSNILCDTEETSRALEFLDKHLHVIDASANSKTLGSAWPLMLRHQASLNMTYGNLSVSIEKFSNAISLLPSETAETQYVSPLADLLESSSIAYYFAGDQTGLEDCGQRLTKALNDVPTTYPMFIEKYALAKAYVSYIEEKSKMLEGNDVPTTSGISTAIDELEAFQLMWPDQSTHAFQFTISLYLMRAQMYATLKNDIGMIADLTHVQELVKKLETEEPERKLYIDYLAESDLIWADYLSSTNPSAAKTMAQAVLSKLYSSRGLASIGRLQLRLKAAAILNNQPMCSEIIAELKRRGLATRLIEVATNPTRTDLKQSNARHH